MNEPEPDEFDPMALYKRVSNGIGGVMLVLMGSGLMLGNVYSETYDWTCIPTCALILLGCLLVRDNVRKK
ncbi:MAG: hypothetical protein AAGG48_28815 [Planctomycetota bacterium]